jgi:hypothetical protein
LLFAGNPTDTVYNIFNWTLFFYKIFRKGTLFFFCVTPELVFSWNKLLDFRKYFKNMLFDFHACRYLISINFRSFSHTSLTTRPKMNIKSKIKKMLIHEEENSEISNGTVWSRMQLMDFWNLQGFWNCFWILNKLWWYQLLNFWNLQVLATSSSRIQFQVQAISYNLNFKF